VDLALVFAIDCSFSVDAAEFRLQMQGLGRALQSAEVLNAIKAGPNQRIAVLAFEWSDKENQKIVLPWSVVASSEDLANVGAQLETMGRLLAEGGTAISNALDFAGQQMLNAPPAVRRVIDVSFDGRNNNGRAVAPVRNRLVQQGITINALPITNEFPTLHIYAESQVIGGSGAFVIKANSYQDYGEAILRKLVKEIVGPGVS
jgi:hypothetical protein